MLDRERATVALHAEAGTHTIRVEVATTPFRRTLGLIGRPPLPDGRSMLFVYPAPREVRFWTWGVRGPLDIAFVGSSCRIISIAASVPAGRTRPIPSLGRVVAVLELRGGSLGMRGVAVGDAVGWDRTASPCPILP